MKKYSLQIKIETIDNLYKIVRNIANGQRLTSEIKIGTKKINVLTTDKELFSPYAMSTETGEIYKNSEKGWMETGIKLFGG